ncbi:uncharacterized protein LOC130591074 [Beta vulgaris subsp. vulgaris]|uniref:uncharacterized protein LOC130591074 n=1 Tax=Beta vulgaris subsp. vulgaris TaxID=3555 RepID=UPI0025486F0C|nr:uncharacterized protein LOC130591074 [Beta vulgaris subsp. vulgaris]
MGDERTLKELGAPKLDDEPLCIVFPTLERPLKLNSGFLNLLPKFYGNAGLLPNDRGMIDAASGGALVDKTPTQARNLIANMAQNTQQHSTRNDVKRVNEIDLSGVKSQLQENAQQIATLTTLVSKIVVGNESKAREAFSNQRKYDPYSQTYNEGWKDHPNLRYGTRPQFSQTNQPRQFGVQNPPPQSSGPSLEDLVKQLTTQIGQVHNHGVEYQKKTDNHLHHIDTQIGQICTSLSNLETQFSGKLPSQPLPNPKENAKAVTLRSGKELSEPKAKSREIEREIEVKPDDELNIGGNGEIESMKDNEGKGKLNSEIDVSRFKDVPPFPSRFAKAKKATLDNEILETFRKVEVNIPLLDAIKQVPRYAKFLKELCTNKRQFHPSEKVSMGENISAVIQKKLPPKCKDPGMFSIPCKIGNSKFERCMLDLGASINVMPKSVYDTLNVGYLSKTDVVIQLADRSNAFPIGVLEDVLVQVNELVFPADFYVLDMGDRTDNVPLLLGRPFLKTSKTKIDVHQGNLTMEFDGEIIKFNIFDAMRYPNDVNNVSSIDSFDAFDWMAQEIFDLWCEKLFETDNFTDSKDTEMPVSLVDMSE